MLQSSMRSFDFDWPLLCALSNLSILATASGEGSGLRVLRRGSLPRYILRLEPVVFRSLRLLSPLGPSDIPTSMVSPRES